VLVVCCANIAGLMLVRAADRQREFAIRTALGAGRRSLARLVVLECLTMSIAAGLAGLGLAFAATRSLVAATSLPIPRLAEVAIDWRVAAFAVVLAIATGLAFSLAPVWRALRVDAAVSMKDSARGSSGRRSPLRGALVAAELTLAVVLVAGGVLLLRSYAAARGVDPGFARRGILTATVTIDQNRYPDPLKAVDFFQQLTTAIASADGVVAAGGISTPPLGGESDQSSAKPEGWVPPAGGESAILADVIRTTPGAFDALGIRVVRGRDFTWHDREGAPPVVIVDESFARKAWPDGNAIGRRVRLDDDPAAEVIGITRHARQYTLEADDRVQVYRPYAQDAVDTLTIAARTNRDPEGLIAPFRRIVAGIDPKQPLASIETMDAVVDRALAGRRLQLEMVGGFAMGALLLCAVGLYGLVSSLVGERTREIGIRVALGASRSEVGRLVVSRIVRLAAIGLAAGTLCALAASRALDHLLDGVSPRDPASLALTAGAVALTVAAAAWRPVRRAVLIAPTEALRD
jgi:putative ABC transport system permease protein